MTRFRRLLRDAAAVLILWALVLAFTWRIALAGRVLAGGDIFTYFYPYWAEATRAIHATRLPLWNPSLFMGAPFLANSQVGFFYPLNWPLWFLLPAYRAVHLAVVLHLCLASLNGYLWGRWSLSLGRLGGWSVAAIFALGGYLGAQVEHVNQLQGLAWLPLILTLHDQASRSRSSVSQRRAGFVGLAVVIGLILLAGHTQTAFISLVGLGVYGLGPALYRGLRRARWQALIRGTALLGGASLLGAALAAVQLVPTWQLSRLSVRAGGLPFNERVSFSLSPLYLARALLPSFAGAVSPEQIEHVAYIGILGLGLALAGCVADVRRWRRSHLVEMRPHGSREIQTCSNLPLYLLTCLGLFLALGLYNPLYLILARVVPGFAHFRVPARWLALYALGVAGLAGGAVQDLWDWRGLGRRGVSLVALALAILSLWGLVGPSLSGAERPALLTVLGWAGATLVATGLLLTAVRAPRPAVLVLLMLLIAELFLATTPLPHVRATAPQAFTSLRPAIAHLLASQSDSGPQGRFLSMSDTTFDPGDLPLMRIIYGPQLSADQLYAYVVAAKQKEIVSPNLPLAFGVPAVDGYDGGVLPLGRYVTLQRLIVAEEDVSFDGRLRENLSLIPDGRWLSLFNVRHVITDKLGDMWIDDIFYDLQFGARLSKGDKATVGPVPPFESTAVGLISRLEEGTALPDGALVGVVEVGFDGGHVRRFELRAGEDVTEQAGVPPYGEELATRLRWPEPARPLTVTVQAKLSRGAWLVRGMSLIDERTGSFQSLVISDRGRFRLAHSGDVKIYENLDVLPRAFIVHRVQLVGDDTAALAAMRDATFDPSSQAVLSVSGDSCSASKIGQLVEADQGFHGEASRLEHASITQYQPEQVVIEARLDEPGVLLLTDAWYPGWQAMVDGERAAICRADLLFRAVALEPGVHRVVLDFRPPGQSVGGALSGLGLVILAIVSRFVFRRAT